MKVIVNPDTLTPLELLSLVFAGSGGRATLVPPNHEVGKNVSNRMSDHSYLIVDYTAVFSSTQPYSSAEQATDKPAVGTESGKLVPEDQYHQYTVIQLTPNSRSATHGSGNNAEAVARALGLPESTYSTNYEGADKDNEISATMVVEAIALDLMASVESLYVDAQAGASEVDAFSSALATVVNYVADQVDNSSAVDFAELLSDHGTTRLEVGPQLGRLDTQNHANPLQVESDPVIGGFSSSSPQQLSTHQVQLRIGEAIIARGEIVATIDESESTIQSDSSRFELTGDQVGSVRLLPTMHTGGIEISDVIATLRHIVGLDTLDGRAALAADVNDDDQIGISDVIAQLRHIVGLDRINSFDAVDENGALVGDRLADYDELELILNGDVNLSTEVTTEFIQVNEPPADITLSSTSISENEGVTLSGLQSFYFIGDLNAVDSDDEDSFSFLIVEQDGTDHAAFFIDSENQKLGLKARPDFESKSSYSVSIQATDSAGNSLTKSFTVAVEDHNEAPVINCCCEACAGSGVSSSSAEDSTFSYTFSASDPDAGDTVTLSAPIKPDWLSFDQSTGVLSGTPAQSDAGDHLVTLQATDNHGLSSSQVFTISVTLVNDTPHISVTSQTSIAENSNQAVAASFAVTDEDDEVVTLALTGNGEDDDLFEIVNGQLRIKASADYEAQSSYRVQVSATDASGASTIKNIEVTVTDEAESVTGTIVDGYVAGATVFQDLDNDNVLDSDEPYTTTSATGAFTLDGVISSATAPLKMITGFDIGTNKAIVTSLGVPTTATGNVIASPLGTIATLAQADDSLTNISTVMDRVATYFGVSDSSQSNIDLINDDPIAGMKSENASVVSASQDAFHANQYVMALAHVAETFGEYISGIVDTAIQNNLSSNGVSDVAALAGGASSDYAKVGADAFFSQASAKIANTGSSNAITDSDDLQAYVFDTKVFEGDTTPTAMVHLNQAFAEDVTLNYALSTRTSDTASAGSDFTATTGTVTILAGFTTATINLPLLADTAIETTETFTLTLSNPSAGSIQEAEAEISIYDSSKTIDSDGELAGLSQLVSDQVASDVTASLVNEYNTYASDIGESWTVENGVASNAAASVLPALRVIADVLYSEITTQIDAATAFTDIDEFAEELMITNAAVKLFDPSDFIGTYIDADGSYPSGQSLTTLTSAVRAAYAQDILDAADTNGDVFGTDTSANFANATVSILTDSNDTETLTSASEIIATYDGTDTVNAGGGNDKVIGGSGVDTFDGEAGNDHLYGYAGNDILTGGSGNDDLYGGLGNDTLAGGAGDDYILGAAGNDTITTGMGTDEALGGLGNDTITVDGAGNKTLTGGAGIDSLVINYGNISSLNDFSITRSGDGAWIVLTDGDGHEISFHGFENIQVGNVTYNLYANNELDHEVGAIFWSQSDKTVHNYEPSSNGILGLLPHAPGLSTSYTGDLTYYGSDGNDSYNFNVPRASGSGGAFVSGDITVSAGAGNDSVYSSRLKNGDSYDLGAGNDTMYIMVSGSHGTPSIANLSLSLLDGGQGSDTLLFQESSVEDGTELYLTTGGATGFENLAGSAADEVLHGDNGDNIISGGGNNITGGDDVVFGYGGNDTITASGELYGGSGDDTLNGGEDSDDILDGGVGRDILNGNGGNDSIILRPGDGGMSLVTADVIQNFSDGETLLLLDGVTFDELIISSASTDGVYSGSAVVEIAATGEYLAIIEDQTPTSINALDFSAANTDPITVMGTANDDVLIGGSGNDSISTGAGNDQVIGWSGNDIVTVDGAGNKTLTGGAGIDSLVINYGNISSLNDFSITRSGDGAWIVLTDGDGHEISFHGFENIQVGNVTYNLYANNELDHEVGAIFWSQSDKTVHNYEPSSNGILGLLPHAPGLSTSYTGDLTYYGSDGNDSYNFNVPRASGSGGAFVSGDITVSAGAGNDSVYSSRLKNGDSYDLGAGNDTMYIMVSGSHGTPSIANLSLSLLDGGQGSDTLLFQESSVEDGTELYLTTGGATGFENLAGSAADEVLHGDNGDNIISGGGNNITGGDDVVFGYGGNDTITASGELYGGSGDDTLNGGEDSDDILDGGVGRDILNGNGGNDSIILRPGDGGMSLVTADVIQNFSDGETLLLLDGVTFDELIISSASTDGVYSGSAVVEIAATGEYLAIIEDQTPTSINALDFSAANTDPITVMGTANDDVLIGGSGNDSISTGAGNDQVIGWSGNDIVTVDGAGNKTLTGGAGIDSLVINYGNISSLNDFSITRSGDGAWIVLTDGDGHEISFHGFENIQVGNVTYNLYANNELDHEVGAIFWSQSDKTVHNYEPSSNGILGLLPHAPGLSTSYTGDLTYYGSDGNDSYNFNVPRASGSGGAFVSGDITVSAGAGNDSVYSSRLKNGDSYDLGAGNDTMYIMVSGSHGTPSIANLSLSLLDGGQGSDTLLFQESSVEDGTELYLTTGGATGFENLAGSAADEVLHGDNGDNIISGGGNNITGGDDVVFGYGGNDTITASGELYGGSGDDTLNGGEDSDDILDGGVGADTVTTGTGFDTIILAANSGGLTLAEADIITDFQDGADVFGLDSNLTFSDLFITQGTGSYFSHAIVRIGSSGEYLAIVQNTAHTNLTIADFSAVSISNYTPEVSSTAITSSTEDSAYSYTLTASDLDGDAITFAAPTLPSWLTFNSTTGVLSGIPTNDNVGEHSVVLTASDGDGATDAQAFTITVANVNDDPTITSTASTEVNEDAAYSYTFIASDIDADDLLTLSATTLPSWLSFNSTTGVLSGTPTNDNVGQHAVALAVSDTAGSSETQSFTITVANVNDAPAISSSAITSVTESQAYSYTFEANDVDIGDSVTLAATTKPAWLNFNEETGVLSGTPSNSHVGDHSVVLTATDSGGTVTTQAFTLTVANVNTAPTVSSTAITTVAEDEAYSYTFAASDVDAGDTITLSATTKPEWLSFDATTGVLSGTPNNNDVGEHSIVLTATDAAGETATQSFTIGVTNVNDTPTVTNAIPDQSVAEDSPISFQFASDVFSDVDANDDLTFEATLANGEELPSWLNFDAQTRTFAGTPTNGDVGDYELRVTATDSSSAAVSDNFIITVTNTNDAPTVANAISDRTTPEDSPFSFQIAENAFNDVDSEDSLTYAATLSNGNPLPSWLSFDTSTKTFSGTPNNDDVGSAEIKVTVTDESGAGTSDTFTLTVTNTNDAPVITSTAKTKSTEGFEYAYTIEANDVDEGDVITLAATTKPDWMTFDSATGVLSGTPMNEHVGDHSVALTATDGSGAVDTQTFTVSVSNTNSAPTISSTAITSVNEDSAYSYTFEATDADVGDTFTLSAQTLPSWLTFNSSTGVLSGTPTNTHVGNHSVVLTATDTNSAVSTQSFTITVSNTNDAPTVSSTALTAVDEDTLYSYTFEAEDVDVGDSLTLAATTKPDWLSFNASTGVLSGTPANTNVGNHSIVLTATDGNGAVTTQSFTLTVTNTNDAPTVTSSAITTVDEDAAYSYTFLAADVDIGDNVSLSATTKPDWLEFDTSTGVLSGTPTNSNVGNHSVVLTATDDSGEEVSQSFTITVANTNDAPVLSVSNGSLTEDSGTYTASGTLVGSDVDANTTLTYSTNTTTGSYGAFTLNTSTGAYSYTLDNANTEVQGLNGSETLLETFTVSVSDGLATTSETLSFTINGTNDSPTGLILSANSVVENNTGATIGTLSAFDLDDDTLTYSLASGGDNSSFEIVGTTLKLKDSIAANYEADNVYDITINVTDGVATQTITEEIWVTNVDESNTAYYNNKVDTNASATLNAQNDPAVEQLMSGRFWGEAGNGIDLTYSFMDTNSLFSSHYNYSGAQLQRDTVQDPSNVFKNTVREILELFESITLLNFTEIEETGNETGHLRFGTSSAEASAFAWFPISDWDAAGDVWLSDTNNYYNNASALMDGTYWHQTIIHEIGHAVGLAHPHEATSYGDRTYGTNSSQGSENNANPYSTMAYPEYVGETLDGSENLISRPTTLMMDDIAALQHLYGINEQYNDTDTTYRIDSFDNGTYNAATGDQNIYGTIWDAGGEDTFTWYDQNTVALIDLNDGEFSCFGDISGPDDTDLDNTWLNDGSGILGIAHNVIIENAIGGTNTDTILGNEADNMLYGGAGASVQDRLTGGAGADTFVVSVSDAATNLGAADIITDFDVGTDKIGLEDATVTDLGWADASGGTQIYDVNSSQVLVFLESVSASALDASDFVQTDFV